MAAGMCCLSIFATCASCGERLRSRTPSTAPRDAGILDRSESIYYKDIFACGKKFLFYCNLGWRSALAAQVSQQMGLSPVAHIGGGFDAWKQAGGPVAQRETK